MIQMNLLSEQKETHKLRDQNYGCHGVRIFRKFGMDVYRLLYIKCITKKARGVNVHVVIMFIYYT